MQLTSARRLRTHFDWPLAATIAGILGIGLLNLYSATLAVRPALFWPQLAWLGVCALLFLGVAAIDYRVVNRLAYVGWLVGTGLLVVVWRFGHVSHGARRWFSVGSGPWIQPSEFMKVLLIVALARYAHDS